jgi:DNA-binding transcriptional regulator PaaX
MKGSGKNLIKVILLVLAAAGGLAVAIAMPNLVRAFAGQYGSGKYNQRQIKRALDYAKRKKLVIVGEEGDKVVVKISNAGKDKILKYKLEEMTLPRQAKWDKKWRLVFSDIPEKFKKNRNAFSLKMKQLGFIAIQRSVWVWPYDCDEEIDFIKEIYGIKSFVITAVAGQIDRAPGLIRMFDL